MGDGIKISKEKRHRSSSSLAEPAVEGTRSERKLDIRMSIPEAEEQFMTAETRCERLQEKIDLSKEMKRKRRLAKRSLTHVEVGQAVRRRPEASNPMRGYVDPALNEQRHMLGLMREQAAHAGDARRRRRARPDGDRARAAAVYDGSDPDDYYQNAPSIQTTNYAQSKSVPRESGEDELPNQYAHYTKSANQRKKHSRKEPVTVIMQNQDERPVVELFNKNRETSAPPPMMKNREAQKLNDQVTGPLENVRSAPLNGPRRRTSRRSRRYELPTLASQLKQNNRRYFYDQPNPSNIPFIVSKSTSPSHNIGVNLQQVLNGVKIQQPLSGIPLTIAHHMGLRHLPTALDAKTTKASPVPELDIREINVLKMGLKYVRLPSYKCISYNRILSLYREGDGMVPRFLRALSRPHYFYTSMYNLTTGHEDVDGSTSKANCGIVGGEEAKKSLKEYAELYHEYEQLENRLRKGGGEVCTRRRDEVARELAAREERIRRIVQELRAPDPEHPSVTNAAEEFRHSTIKVSAGVQ